MTISQINCEIGWLHDHRDQIDAAWITRLSEVSKELMRIWQNVAECADDRQRTRPEALTLPLDPHIPVNAQN